VDLKKIFLEEGAGTGSLEKKKSPDNSSESSGEKVSSVKFKTLCPEQAQYTADSTSDQSR
jgi:hypothetical protein